MGNVNHESKVSLGCGSLILIALIVLIFAGGGNKENKQEIQRLQTEIQGLRGDVEKLSAQVEMLGGGSEASVEERLEEMQATLERIETQTGTGAGE